MAEPALEFVRSLDTIVSGRTLVTASVTTRDELVLLLTTGDPSHGPYDAVVARVGDGWSHAVALHGLRARFPRVQWMGQDEVVVVDSRCSPGERNAQVFDLDGRLEREFRVGDAVQDIRTTRLGELWVSYFDEGAFQELGCARHAPGVSTRCSGLARFDREGRLEWSYMPPAGLRSMLECYAMNVDDASTFIVPYPGFSLVRIAREDAEVRLQETVPGCRAIAVGRRRVLFYGDYAEPRSFWECDLGAEPQRCDLTAPEGARVLGVGASMHVVTAREWLRVEAE